MKFNYLTSLVSALIIYTTVNAQDCQRIFISEYVTGSGNNKAIELYNPTNEPVNLAGYVLERWSNGEQSATDQLNLAGIIPPFGTWVVVNGQTEAIDLGTFISPACDPELQALADQLDNPYPAPTFFNGNDALVLVNYGVSPPLFDIFGKPGEDPGPGWTDPDGNIITALQTLIRKAEVTQGVTVPPTTFMPLDEWVPIGLDNWSNLGEHSCGCNEDGSANEITIYANEFDDQSEWTFINEGDQGTWNVVTTQDPDLVDFMGNMQSVTSENGFAEFVGITFLLEANVELQNSIIELNDPINCSELSNVAITFNQRARAFNYDDNFLEVSNDGGNSWVPFQVNDDLVTNADAIQGELTIDVTDIAAGEPDVRVRFRWVSDPLGANPDLTPDQVNSFGSGYGWMLDDLAVSSSTGCTVSVDLGDTQSYCNQESAIIDAGDGYASYLWNTGESTSAIEVNASGTYTVEVINDAGCSATDSVYVDFLSVNILQQDTLVAPGQPVSIEVEASNSDQLSYLWSNGATTPIIEVNPTQNTTYTVAVSNGITTCTDNVTVTVFCEVEGGILEVTNPLTEFCVGDNASNFLTVQVNGNSGLGSYGIVDASSFDILGGNISGTFNFENYPPGDYLVGYVSYTQQDFLTGKENISDFDGCFDISNLIAVSTYALEGGVITANQSNTFCLGESAPTQLGFSVSGEVGPNFRWALLNQAFSQVILSNQSGTFNIQNLIAGVYRVVHVAYGDEVVLSQVDPQNIMGCVDISNSLSVVLLDCGGLINLDIKTNPVSYNSTVLFSSSKGGMTLLEIYDMSGRLVRSVYNGYAEEAVEYQVDTDLSDLTNGVYLYRLTTDETVVTEKFIVSR